MATKTPHEEDEERRKKNEEEVKRQIEAENEARKKRHPNEGL